MPKATRSKRSTTPLDTSTVYPPREDSLLLAGVVSQRAHGNVLDMGCGSGIQTMTALLRKDVRSVLGVDMNPAAVAQCSQAIQDKRARFIRSDLFEKIPACHRTGRFDTIIFNPPYLPADGFSHGALIDAATIGGKHGWETIERFLRDAPDYLAVDGSILLLFTSLTNKVKVHELIANAMLSWRCLATNHISMETYYVYELGKTAACVDAERKGVRGIGYLAKGRRGLVYKGTLRGKPVVLKVHNPSSKAVGTLKTEAAMLRRVNRNGIGPKLLFATDDCVGLAFVDGLPIRSWLPTARRQRILQVLRNVLAQCRTLDRLGLHKEEMHHPHKHIIVPKKGAPVMIDFERARKMQKPHNVTQFVHYITTMAPDLQRKRIIIDVDKLRGAAKAYSMASTNEMFKRIVF